MAERFRPLSCLGVWLSALLIGAGVLAAPANAASARWSGLFDMPARKEALGQPGMAQIRKACLSAPTKLALRKLQPILALAPTEGYGSDNSAEDFSWAVMVLSGRALADDAEATNALKKLMLGWADAGAFGGTQESYDPYYALKRQLLPLSVAYQILQPGLEPDEDAALRGWIDPLVRRIDARFDREVDHNNHRILADSVLAVWGSVIGDEALVDKGIDRFRATLEETRADGTLPLEARRGSRALWYQRQTLASLTVIAEVARGQGVDLYAATSEDGTRSLSTLVGALVNGLDAPLLVTVYNSENHIPGPQKDYLKPDLGFLETRGHGRHYMAFAEAASEGGADLSLARLDRLLRTRLTGDRPLIDEFVGGNATCFWGRP